jgi:hypothetical protein
MASPSLALPASSVLTSPLITSPANALPASRIREYDFINGLDGDVGLDRTPPGVWSPVAHPTVDDSSLLDGVMRKPAAMTLHKLHERVRELTFVIRSHLIG